jgi:signal peptidase II
LTRVPPPGAAPRSYRARIGAYRWLFVLAISVFVADQLTKMWIAARWPLDTYPPLGDEVIPGFFYLVHVGNTGAAWSLFADKSLWLAALAIITLSAIFIFRRHLELGRPLVQVSFGLLCGGIVGNLVDRLMHGHVIDFLLFIFWGWEFPVFNVADTAICIGVGLYLIHSFRAPQGAPREPETTKEASAPPTPAP